MVWIFIRVFRKLGYPEPKYLFCSGTDLGRKANFWMGKQFSFIVVQSANFTIARILREAITDDDDNEYCYLRRLDKTEAPSVICVPKVYLYRFYLTLLQLVFRFIMQMFLFVLLYLWSFLANTQRPNNVDTTSLQRCSDVVTTFLRRCVFAGLVLFWYLGKSVHITKTCLIILSPLNSTFI